MFHLVRSSATGRPDDRRCHRHATILVGPNRRVRLIVRLRSVAKTRGAIPGARTGVVIAEGPSARTDSCCRVAPDQCCAGTPQSRAAARRGPRLSSPRGVIGHCGVLDRCGARGRLGDGGFNDSSPFRSRSPSAAAENSFTEQVEVSASVYLPFENLNAGTWPSTAPDYPDGAGLSVGDIRRGRLRVRGEPVQLWQSPALTRALQVPNVLAVSTVGPGRA